MKRKNNRKKRNVLYTIRLCFDLLLMLTVLILLAVNGQFTTAAFVAGGAVLMLDTVIILEGLDIIDFSPKDTSIDSQDKVDNGDAERDK